MTAAIGAGTALLLRLLPGRLDVRTELSPPRGPIAALAGCAGVAVAALAVVPAAPGYDAWSWLVWGREVAALELSTTGGPAFKPLPVAVCALLAPFGDLAPALWVWLALTGALIAVVLAIRLGWELSGGSWLAGGAAGAGVAFAGQYLALAAGGGSEGLLLASTLLGVLAIRKRRPGAALACAAACGLLRVETWPFLLLAAGLAWRRRAADRRLLGALVLVIPALWFVPEWIGSGDALRSAERARVPNPGQPALAAFPALASLREAGHLFVLPVAAGVAGLFLARPPRVAALALGAAGAAWLALVGAMSQAGFSGEGRYSLPGVGLLAVAGGVGLAEATRRLGALGDRRVTVGLVSLLLAASVIPRALDLRDVRAALIHRARLSAGLEAAVETMGGPSAVLRCGRPYVGSLRGPLAAWHLGVDKRRVGFRARVPGVLFRSRLDPRARLTPAPRQEFRKALTTETWEVAVACGASRAAGGSTLR